MFHFPFFSAVVQQDPSFPPDMSPTSPLLSPQSSTSQTPLLQQAPPPGYQSPDMKSWQQTGISSNRWEGMCSVKTFSRYWSFLNVVALTCFISSVAACSVSQDRVQGRPLASRGSTTTWASLSPWLEAPVVLAHYLPWRRQLATVTSTMLSQCAATSRFVIWNMQQNSKSTSSPPTAMLENILHVFTRCSSCVFCGYELSFAHIFTSNPFMGRKLNTSWHLHLVFSFIMQEKQCAKAADCLWFAPYSRDRLTGGRL